MADVSRPRVRRNMGVSLALIGASMAIQSVMSDHWARACGVSQETALAGIVVVHAIMAGIALWRAGRCADGGNQAA